MNETTEVNQERRGGSKQLIEHMLTERNQLFSLLLQATPNDVEDVSEESDGSLEEFLQVLVDYIAAGHFGLYQRIAEGKERRKAVADLAVDIYPRIEKTTEIALAFDEKYNAENESRDLNQLQNDLSRLGEELSTRIEFEDQLISIILDN